MCGIFASSDVQIFLELAKINQPRGVRGWSVTILDEQNNVRHSLRSHNEAFPCELPTGNYYIGHMVAPTSGEIRHHPACLPACEGGDMLWHNGILKASYVKHLRNLLTSEETWDTMLFLRFLHTPSCIFSWADIQGSYSCIHLSADRILTIFRNGISPMFHNGTDLSSIEAPLMRETSANTVYLVNIPYNNLIPIIQYTDHNTPYLLGE